MHVDCIHTVHNIHSLIIIMFNWMQTCLISMICAPVCVQRVPFISQMDFSYSHNNFHCYLLSRKQVVQLQKTNVHKQKCQWINKLYLLIAMCACGQCQSHRHALNGGGRSGSNAAVPFYVRNSLGQSHEFTVWYLFCTVDYKNKLRRQRIVYIFYLPLTVSLFV